MGGGKGGSNFDPKGKSDGEVMRFCQSFMTSCAATSASSPTCCRRHRVGGREIGFLSASTSASATSSSACSPAGPQLGRLADSSRGDRLRYGLFRRRDAYHARRDPGRQDLSRQRFGQRAQYAIEKTLDLGGKALTCSDSGGYIYDEAGIDRAKLAYLMELKNVKLAASASTPTSTGPPSTRRLTRRRTTTRCGPQGRLRLPERDPERDQRQDAANLLKNGVYVVSEGANMPTVPEASSSSSRRASSTARQGRQRRRRRHLRS